MRFLILIFAFGLLASVLANVGPRSGGGGEILQKMHDDETRRIAELKADNEPHFSSQDGAVELQRSSDGHFYADVRVNGATVNMLVDTGASGIVLSRDDARTAGLATSIAMNEVVGEGADGAVHGEFARLDKVELGPLTAEGLDAIVVNSGEQSLLGQQFLAKFESVQIEGDRMVLR